MAWKRSMLAAGVDKPTLKSAKTTAKAAAAQRFQHPPPPLVPANAQPFPPPLAQEPSVAASGARNVLDQEGQQNSIEMREKTKNDNNIFCQAIYVASLL
jgi:hypothetical protein